MTFFPEILYNPTVRDQADLAAEIFGERTVVSANAATINADVVVPAGRVLLVEGVFMELVPDAAQNAAADTNLQVRWPGNQLRYLIFSDAAGAVGAVRRLGLQQLRVPLPAGAVIRLEARFNAGVNLNAAQLNVWGLTIPYGNIRT